MKRKINLLLSALAIFTMTSCGSNGTNPPITKDDGDCVSIVSIELTSSEGLEDTYTITFDLNGGKFASDFDSSLFENIKSGSLVDLPYPYRENHTFAGWFISKNYKASEFTSSMPVTQNLNLVAKWNDPSTSRCHFSETRQEMA